MFIHCFSLSATLYTYIWIVCSVHANGLCNRIAFRSLSLILFFSDYLRLYFSISYYLIIPILVICNLFFSSSFHQQPHSHIRLFSLSPILLFFTSSVSFSLSLHSTVSISFDAVYEKHIRRFTRRISNWKKSLSDSTLLHTK